MRSHVRVPPQAECVSRLRSAFAALIVPGSHPLEHAPVNAARDPRLRRLPPGRRLAFQLFTQWDTFVPPLQPLWTIPLSRAPWSLLSALSSVDNVEWHRHVAMFTHQRFKLSQLLLIAPTASVIHSATMWWYVRDPTLSTVRRGYFGLRTVQVWGLKYRWCVDRDMKNYFCFSFMHLRKFFVRKYSVESMSINISIHFYRFLDMKQIYIPAI